MLLEIVVNLGQRSCEVWQFLLNSLIIFQFNFFNFLLKFTCIDFLSLVDQSDLVKNSTTSTLKLTFWVLLRSASLWYYLRRFHPFLYGLGSVEACWDLSLIWNQLQPAIQTDTAYFSIYAIQLFQIKSLPRRLYLLFSKLVLSGALFFNF